MTNLQLEFMSSCWCRLLVPFRITSYMVHMEEWVRFSERPPPHVCLLPWRYSSSADLRQLSNQCPH